MSRSPQVHVVLLAGGSGTRFWPLSRKSRPKQFLPLAGKRSLLRDTWDRARSLAPASRIHVVAPRELAQSVRKELGIDTGRLIVEPSPRDTAPAIALACARIARTEPGATVAVFPCDHVIRDAAAFRKAVGAAVRAAGAGALVCLGIKPDRPATGFGYLQLGKTPRDGSAMPVRRFVEKPDPVRARRFVRSGRHLWNGGMFVWRVDAFLAELRRVAPAIASAAADVAAGSRAAWQRMPKISIDFAVMEKARRVEVVPLDAGWDDLGSWDAAVRYRTSRSGKDVVLLGSAGTYVFGGSRMVAVLDLPDVVVVDTPDALLVASRAASEKMKAVVESVRAAGRDELL